MSVPIQHAWLFGAENRDCYVSSHYLAANCFEKPAMNIVSPIYCTLLEKMQYVLSWTCALLCLGSNISYISSTPYLAFIASNMSGSSEAESPCACL